MNVLAVFRLPLLLPFLLSDQREMILQDVRRWRELTGMVDSSELICLLRLLCENLQFRSVYFYRVQQGNLAARAAGHAASLLYRSRESLYIYATEGVGPGLYIEHGFSTIIDAKRIGRTHMQDTYEVPYCDTHGRFFDESGNTAHRPNMLANTTSRPDETAVFSVLQFGAIIPPLSPWQGVQRFLPGYQYHGIELVGPVKLERPTHVATLDPEQLVEESIRDSLPAVLLP